MSSSDYMQRTNVACFVHTLHLLDLDRRDDWPVVTEQTFSSRSNLQQRLRCAEWSLYRLFEIYDFRLTRDKLQPFFPPTTSLQSLNLRAALLRQLTELKRVGVLGPNLQLRKTMLDECKGEKFEEVLAALATIVLRNHSAHNPVPLNSTLCDAVTIVPLLIAHRVSLRTRLEQRKDLLENYVQQRDRTEKAREQMSKREQILKNKECSALDIGSAKIQQLVRENWLGPGDPSWRETVLRGIVRTSENQDPEDLALQDEYSNTSKTLTTLQTRIELQTARTAKWRESLSQTPKSQLGSGRQTNSSKVTTGEAPSRFSRHRSLIVDQRGPIGAHKPPRLLAQHSALLEQLQGEISAPDKELKSPPSVFDAAKQEITHSSTSRFDPVSVPRSLLDARPSIVPPPIDASPEWRSSLPSEMITPHLESANRVMEDVDASEFSPVQLKALQPVASDTPYDNDNTKNTKTSDIDQSSVSVVTRVHDGSRSHNSESRWKIVRTPTLDDKENSLLERTRQSILRATTDRGSLPARAWHRKSQSTYSVTSKHAANELGNTGTRSIARDDFDIDLNLEDPFRSRPKLAHSPKFGAFLTENSLIEEEFDQGIHQSLL